jgi:hypothetical protein
MDGICLESGHGFVGAGSLSPDVLERKPSGAWLRNRGVVKGRITMVAREGSSGFSYGLGRGRILPG